MRIPYENLVELGKLGFPMRPHLNLGWIENYVTYEEAFNWFEDKGIILDVEWEEYDRGFSFTWRLSCKNVGDRFYTSWFGVYEDHNDRSIRYPKILDKMIEVYKEHFLI